MCGPYWSQWDKDDLDSWQGKDYRQEDEDDEVEDDLYEEEASEEEGCSCGYYCFDCLGISWQDFL